MVNAFDVCSEFEQECWDTFLKDFFVAQSTGGVVTIEKGRLARRLQLEYGDAVMNAKPRGSLMVVECKSERDHTGNLFAEVWSNRARRRVGWLHHLNADGLGYFFADQRILYTLSLPAFQDWCFGKEPGKGRLYGYKEVRQQRQVQHNDTWGRLVNIRHLVNANVALRAWRLPEAEQIEPWNEPGWPWRKERQ